MTLIRAFLKVFSGFLYFLINALNRVITTIVLSVISGYAAHTGSDGYAAHTGSGGSLDRI
jgi:hypothetical protein